MTRKRILITGHNGYIGSVMAPAFAGAGYEVTGLDTGYFSRCTLVPDKVRLPFINKDIRSLSESDLEGFHG
ncbi:MAG: NAD-dependent epimerase/dehydratase family protein, partial [Candidatus Binatia bacterium]